MSADMQASIRSNWQRIEQSIPGVTFNYDFWTDCVPRRSTYMSCRAVIAAREQGQQYDVAMTKAIQQAYYQQARNPSDVDTLVALAGELGLDSDAFLQSITSQRTQSVLMQEIMQSADIGVASYPGLRLKVAESIWPIAINYNAADEMLELIDTLLS
jgi:putative protein-disulfide isomerase